MSQATSLKSCLALLAVLGCSGEMSIEDARNETVVTVAGAELDGATLERVLLATPPQSPGPSRETAAVTISAFIDAALLRQALVRGDSLTDSLTVLEAIAPDAIRGQILGLLQDRAARVPEPTDEQADSLGRLGGVRTFQQILIRVADLSDSVEATAAGRRVRAILDELARPGVEFGDVARRVSDDTVTAPSGGHLPPLRQRDIPQQYDFAARVWALSPGDLSRPILSPSGVHLIRRTTLVEGRPGFKQYLRPVLARTADSIWVDSLSRASSLTLASDVVSRVRQLAVEPYSGGGDAPYATWEGGELTADETRMWISVMPMTERVALPVAPDSALTLFIEQLAERDLVAAQVADTARVTARAWDALAPQFRTAISAVVEQYREPLTAGESTPTLRNFLIQVTSGQLPYLPLPGALGLHLRRGAEVEINQRALDAVVRESARQWQLARGADSTPQGARPDSTPPDSAAPSMP